MHVHRGSVSEPVNEQRRALDEPNQMGLGGVGPGSEFVEVPAAAERWTVSRDGDGVDRVVDDRNRERVAEFVAQPASDRIVAVGAIQTDRQLVVPAVDVNCGPVVAELRGPVAAPLGELVAALEHGVHGRLGSQGGVDRDTSSVAQQHGERCRCSRCDRSEMHQTFEAVRLGDDEIGAVRSDATGGVAEPCDDHRQGTRVGKVLRRAGHDDQSDVILDQSLLRERVVEKRRERDWVEVERADDWSVGGKLRHHGRVEGPGVVDAPLDGGEAAQLWAASGAQWLTQPGVGVPVGVVRRLVGLTGALDGLGAGLGDLVPAEGVGFLAERAAVMGLPRASRVSCGGASRLMRGSDGWFVMSLARDDDIALVPAWLEIDPIDGPDPWPVVEAAVADRAVGELSGRGGLLGLPCGAVGEVDDDRPVLVSRIEAAPPMRLEGALVVNLASLWAGPLCADVLARLGARVIKVESTRRPDGGRLARRFFAGLHGRSESVALDLTTESGRADLCRLLLAADVVVEGSRPRALEQMGIDAREVVAGGPKVWLSITARGRGPGDRDRIGFGDDAAAAGGLVGWIGDEPTFIADAIADPLTGLTAAYAIADLLSSEGRWLVDVALARVARSVKDGPMIEPVGPAARPKPRNDPGAALPLGCHTRRVLSELGS